MKGLTSMKKLGWFQFTFSSLNDPISFQEFGINIQKRCSLESRNEISFQKLTVLFAYISSVYNDKSRRIVKSLVRARNSVTLVIAAKLDPC